MKNSRTLDSHTEIVKYLLEEVVKVSFAVCHNVMTLDETNRRLHDKAENCVEKYGLQQSRKGLGMFHQVLLKSAPNGQLTFCNKDGHKILVPILKEGIEDYFSDQVRK